MSDLTTIKVSTETRDELRALAGDEPMDRALRRILRHERQRRMGEELAATAGADESFVEALRRSFGALLTREGAPTSAVG